MGKLHHLVVTAVMSLQLELVYRELSAQLIKYIFEIKHVKSPIWCSRCRYFSPNHLLIGQSVNH